MGNTNSNSLPPEINENIASYLDIRQLHRAATTNKYLHSHMSDRIRARSAMNAVDGYLAHPYAYHKYSINDRGNILRKALKDLPPEKAAAYWKPFVKTVETLRDRNRGFFPQKNPDDDDDDDALDDPTGRWNIMRTAVEIVKLNYSPEDFEKLVGGPQQMQTPLAQELIEQIIDESPWSNASAEKWLKYLPDTSHGKQEYLAYKTLKELQRQYPFSRIY